MKKKQRRTVVLRIWNARQALSRRFLDDSRLLWSIVAMTCIGSFSVFCMKAVRYGELGVSPKDLPTSAFVWAALLLLVTGASMRYLIRRNGTKHKRLISIV